VFLPNLVIATGQGAMVPVLVYAARQVHASSAQAVMVVALNGLGTMLFDLPAGRLTARFGERRSAQLAAGMLAGGLVGCVLASSFLVLASFVALQAAGWALWSLVRLVHLSRVAPPEVRGRALSLFGGVIRAGNVIGPFVFVAVSARSDARASFVIYFVSVVVGVAWLLAARDRKDRASETGRAQRVRPVKILVDHRRSFATAGLGVFAISLLRGSRTAIVPLWAAHIGLDAKGAAAIFALSSVIDLALFYPAGVMSDRFGRRAVVLPCLTLLSVGHILVPFSHSYLTLFWAAFILGFGNGFGSGIVMTLGADLTPAVGRASFLAVWRLVSDGGTSAGPLLDSAIVGLGAIALVGPVVGVVGLTAALAVAIWLAEPAPGRPAGLPGRAPGDGAPIGPGRLLE
jgi:MFS family permease